MTTQTNKDYIKLVLEDFDKLGIIPHTMPNAIGLWPNEQECLAWCASQCDPNKNWLEIGSFCGGSSIILGLLLDVVGPTSKVIAVDPSPNPMYYFNIKRSKLNNIVHLKCKGEDLLTHYEEPISFAFIDGWHSFSAVLKDVEAVSNLMDSDGIIAFHDVSPEMWTPTQEHIDNCLDYAYKNWNMLMNNTQQDFRLDEVIAYLCTEHNYEIIDIPPRQPLEHFKETGLNKWVRGTTSPHNAFTAIRKKNEITPIYQPA